MVSTQYRPRITVEILDSERRIKCILVFRFISLSLSEN